jgi:hypothetical protein
VGAAQQMIAPLVAGLQLGGGVLEGRSAKAEAGAVSDAALYNRQLALREGSREEARRRKIGRLALGEQRAQMGASGLAPSGSPLRALAANAYEYERSALDARLEAQGTANLEAARAASAKQIGKRAKTAALFGGAARAAGYGLPLYVGRR